MRHSQVPPSPIASRQHFMRFGERVWGSPGNCWITTCPFYSAGCCPSYFQSASCPIDFQIASYCPCHQSCSPRHLWRLAAGIALTSPDWHQTWPLLDGARPHQGAWLRRLHRTTLMPLTSRPISAGPGHRRLTPARPCASTEALSALPGGICFCGQYLLHTPSARWRLQPKSTFIRDKTPT